MLLGYLLALLAVSVGPAVALLAVHACRQLETLDDHISLTC